jgi:hypothetical protein
MNMSSPRVVLPEDLHRDGGDAASSARKYEAIWAIVGPGPVRRPR